MTDTSNLLQITSAATSVLFYSTYDTTKVNTNVKACCSFSNVVTTDPSTSSVVTTNDGSYALYIHLRDLAAGASDEFVWYYAALPTSEIGTVVTNVAAAAVTPTITAPTE
jgi:hypothetical protein